MTTKSMKRIHKVTIKRMVDTDSDTSWLGEYSSKAESEYAIDRAHSEDCASHFPTFDCPSCGETFPELKAGEECPKCHDAVLEEAEQDCNCSGGDMGRNEYRYFNGPVENYKGESPEDVRKYVRQDYERMESLNRGDWSFIGIRAEAEVSVTGDIKQGVTIQHISSGGLGGIESDSGASYFQEIEQEQLSELREQLHAIGFSYRAISAAFKNVEHRDA